MRRMEPLTPEDEKIGNRMETSVFFPPKQRIERVEQITGDLISFIAKTQVKTTNFEYQLVQLEMIAARLETKYKVLIKENAEILQRLEKLEQRVDELTSPALIL